MKSNIRPAILAALSLSSSALSFLSASSFSSLSLFSSIFFSSFLLKYEAKKLSLRASHSLKASSSILSNLSHSERLIFSNCPQLLKALSPIAVMLLGSLVSFSDEQYLNAPSPIVSSFSHSERSIFSNSSQSKKAHSPIDFMLLGSLAILFFVNIFQLIFSVYDSDSFKNVDFHNLLCYKINARKMNATRMTQKNLQKHPIHPVIPSPRKEATKPKACTPQPIKPRMTKAITNMPMNPSIAIMSFMLLYRYFLVTVPLCERT